MQTGAQLTAGFLLTLPFQQKFADLDDFQTRPLPRHWCVLAALTTAIVMTPGGHPPAALRRARQGAGGRSPAHRLVYGVLTCAALLIVGHGRC